MRWKPNAIRRGLCKAERGATRRNAGVTEIMLANFEFCEGRPDNLGCKRGAAELMFVNIITK